MCNIGGLGAADTWKFALALHAKQNPFAGAALAQLFAPLFAQDALLRGGFGGAQQGGYNSAMQGLGGGSPTAGIPQPNVQFSGAPVGKGLEKGPEGWPKDAVKTAGGYTIVPEGKDNAWAVYDKNAKPGDKPMTRVWGDPHVNEKDGTNWDFTKSSNFRLPDGTNIAVNTTSENGQSVTKGLDITNGSDRIQMSGIDTNNVSVGDVTHDGFQARANLDNNRDTFHLGGHGGEDVKWFKESGGLMKGEVTSSQYDHNTQRYEQNMNADSQYFVDPSLRPAIGSPAWGNQLRMEAVDIARRSGNPDFANGMASLMEGDQLHGMIKQNLGYDPQMLFGGYGMGYGQQTFSVGAMFGALQYQEQMNQLGALARQNMVFA